MTLIHSTVQPSGVTPRRVSGGITLQGVSWETYELLLRDVANQGVAITYDHGALEIMPPSPAHEKIGNFIARMVEIVTLELRIPVVGLGRTTWNSQRLLRGLEADECYYIKHAEWATGREEFDLSSDPPPDLVIEVDISSSSLNKEDIYRELRMPELWRYEAGKLVIRTLGDDGVYADGLESVCLPMLPVSLIENTVAKRNSRNDTDLMADFQAWVRKTLISNQ